MIQLVGIGSNLDMRFGCWCFETYYQDHGFVTDFSNMEFYFLWRISRLDLFV